MGRNQRRALMAISMPLILLLGQAVAWSYGLGTHEAVNERAARVSQLDSYLRSELGLNDGLATLLQDREVFRWIRIGGSEEDTPPIRSRNHFHDPTTADWGQAGLNTFFLRGQSSVLWAQNPSQGPNGKFSWQDARRYFLKGLTEASKTGREEGLANTFRALGQVMHLIVDAAVPAHTRNDSHVIEDGYENFVEDTVVNRRGDFDRWIAQPFRFDPRLLDPPYNPSSLFPFTKILDADVYARGANPDTTLGGNVGMAEYTNPNFVSDDTILRDYPFPARASLDSGFFDPPAGTPGARQYFRKIRDGERVDHFVAEGSFVDRLIRRGAQGRGYRLDDRVYADYAAKLLPRAVGYAAGLLDHFFRGRFTVERVGPLTVPDVDRGILDTRGWVRLKVLNDMAEERMIGTVTLYYDDPEDGLRKAVSNDPVFKVPTGFSIDLGPGETSDEFVIQTFLVPESARTEGRYLAVFVGRLGMEPDAVAATFAEIAPPQQVGYLCRGPFGDCALFWENDPWDPESAGHVTLTIDAIGTGAGTVHAFCLERCGGCGTQPGDVCSATYSPTISSLSLTAPNTLSFTDPTPRGKTSYFFLEFSVPAGGFVCIFNERNSPGQQFTLNSFWGFSRTNCPE